MARPAALLVFVCAVLASCDDSEPDAQVESVSVQRIPAEMETASVAETPIDVGWLPETGFVVDTRRGVVFLDLSGGELHELPGVSLRGNPGAPGLWFERDTGLFKLDADRGLLIPMPRESASRMYNEGRPPRLPIPAEAPRIGGDVVGHWRFAHRSPTGAVLAQWSGECEVPTAYWIEPGTVPRIATGGSDFDSAPHSFALGWSPDGRAFVYVGGGTCGGRRGRGGIYAFERPGEGEVLYPARRGSSAEMWTR